MDGHIPVVKRSSVISGRSRLLGPLSRQSRSACGDKERRDKVHDLCRRPLPQLGRLDNRDKLPDVWRIVLAPFRRTRLEMGTEGVLPFP